MTDTVRVIRLDEDGNWEQEVIHQNAPAALWAVFAGQRYYARGGWHDFMSVHGDPSEAIAAAERLVGTEIKTATVGDDSDPEDDIRTTIQWYHVVNLSTGRIVTQSPLQPYGAP